MRLFYGSLDDLAHLLSQKECVQNEQLRQMLSEAALGPASSSFVHPSNTTGNAEKGIGLL